MHQSYAWTLLLLIIALTAASDEPKTSEPTSRERDNNPVIQKVRGLRNSGMKLNDNKDFGGAIENLREAITLLHDRVFGEGRHEVTDPADISQDAALYAQILNDYGSVLIRAKQYDEAIEVLEDSIKMVEKIYGESHPSLGLSLRSLANAYMAKNEYKVAIQKFKTLRKHIEKGLGVTHEAYIEASLRIAEGYKKLGKNKKNLKILKDTLKAQGKEINGLTTGIAELYMELSSAHAEMNELNEAQKAAEIASSIFLQRDGDAAMSYAFSLNALAGVKVRQKKLDEAVTLLERAHEIAVSIHGENDPLTKASAKTLSDVKNHLLDLQAERDEL